METISDWTINGVNCLNGVCCYKWSMFCAAPIETSSMLGAAAYAAAPFITQSITPCITSRITPCITLIGIITPIGVYHVWML